MNEVRPYTIETASGIYFDLNHPMAGAIRCHDIANTLSRIPRFNGHAARNGRPYSVAQHSIDCFERMKRIVGLSPNLIAWALFHDAHEVYIGDISRPLHALLESNGLTILSTLKRGIDREVCKKFGIDPVVLDSSGFPNRQMKLIDEQALRDEAFTFMKSSGFGWSWSKQFDGIAPNEVDDPMKPEDACHAFMNRITEVRSMGFSFEID